MDRIFPAKGDFEKKVLKHCNSFGKGLKNFHIHGDRAYTREDRFYSNIGKSINELDELSLSEKQKLTWALHDGPAFYPECIRERGERLLNESIKFGIDEIWTTVDVTYNTKLKSLEIWEKLKKDFEDKIKVKLWAYNPSGFKPRSLDDERYALFEEAALRCDGIVALAEKDRKIGHIGESQHNLYIANLSHKLKKPAQYHVGQANSPNDNTVERLLEDIEYLQDYFLRESPDRFPKQFMVHAISPTCKSDSEFENIKRRMIQRNFSLITCPRAAISMLQNREEKAPIHNSIARAWDFASDGIDLFLGIDNLFDIFIPATSADIYEESEYLANSLRNYKDRLIAKVLCGEKLDSFDKGTLIRSRNN